MASAESGGHGKAKRTTFISVDRQSSELSWLDEPDRYRDVLRLQPGEPLIAQGAGLSYVAASFGRDSHTIGMRHFDRILGFDPTVGSIRVEAGATLGKLYEFLTPHGRMLPVQPGHPAITVGGCIAANVHGKNHVRDGCFANTVRMLRLFHPSHGEITLSPSDDPDLFHLTLGGYGLTGIILSAELSTVPLPGHRVSIEHRPVGSLVETAEAIGRLQPEVDFIYSWNDLTRPGRSTGAGMLFLGRFDQEAQEDDADMHPVGPSQRRPVTDLVPLTVPLLSGPLLPLISWLYHRANSRRYVRTSPYKASFPLAGWSAYFKAYGRRGLFEHQVLVPDSVVEPYLTELVALVARHEQPIGLFSLKGFRGARRLLRFDGSGYSIAFDVRADANSLAFLHEVDALDSDHGCIANLIKDSRLSRDVARRQYTEFDAFAGALRRFDPNRIFRSSLSERLGL